MATVEVASATSAFQDEKIEEPMNKPQLETNTVKETDQAAPPETTHEEVVKETEAAAAEAETLAAEVETKVVVKETTEMITTEEPETEPERAGVEATKVAPEPSAHEEITIKEADQPAADFKVVTEEEEKSAEDKVIGNEAAEAAAAAAAAEVDKSI